MRARLPRHFRVLPIRNNTDTHIRLHGLRQSDLTLDGRSTPCRPQLHVDLILGVDRVLSNLSGAQVPHRFHERELIHLR